MRVAIHSLYHQISYHFLCAMWISLFLLLTFPLALGEQLVIPAVQSTVAEQLSRFSKYTAYKAAPTVVLPTATPHVKVNALAAPAVAAPAVANAPFAYWYETIAHQGKAAFNSDSSYVVYRNVKSYGAKG